MNNAQKLIVAVKSVEAIAEAMRVELCKEAEINGVKLDKAQKENNQALIDVLESVCDSNHDAIKKLDVAAKEFSKAAHRLEACMFFVPKYAFSES